MKKKLHSPVIGLVLGITLASQTGCAGPAKVAVTPEQPAAEQPAAERLQALQISGKVSEAIDAGGYTYVCVENNGKKNWAAIPTTKLKVGDQVELKSGAVFYNFESKSLNRTFDSIVFSAGVQEDPSRNVVPQDTKYSGRMSETAILSGKVLETMTAATYTYLLIEKDGKVAWSAIPAADIKVGDEVELIKGMDMGTFSSPTLKRGFKAIHFSAGLKKGSPKALELAKAQETANAPGAAKAPEAVKAPEAAKTPIAADATLPQGHPALPKQDAAAKPAAPPAAREIAGKVVETMDAGGYSYVCLEKNGAKTWAAIPVTTVKVGQEMSLLPGMEMTNFKSTSLKRTFDKIIFSNGEAAQ